MERETEKLVIETVIDCVDALQSGRLLLEPGDIEDKKNRLKTALLEMSVDESTHGPAGPHDTDLMGDDR